MIYKSTLFSNMKKLQIINVKYSKKQNKAKDSLCMASH